MATPGYPLPVPRSNPSSQDHRSVSHESESEHFPSPSPVAIGATPIIMATPCLRLAHSIPCQQATSPTTAAAHFCTRLSVPLHRPNHTCLPPTWSSRRRQSESVVVASGGDIGDFGARDPFPAEIESDFGNRPQGWADTEHQIAKPSNIR